MAMRGGGSVVRCAPAFSNDGKRALICKSIYVSVVSMETALEVGQLHGHTDTVTSVVVLPPSDRGPNLAWTSSLDGTIRLWDFVSEFNIRTVTVLKPIESMVIPSLQYKTTQVIAFLSVHRRAEEGNEHHWMGLVIIVDLTSGKPFQGSLAKTALPQQLVASPSGAFIGMTDKKKIWIWRVPSEAFDTAKTLKSCHLHHTKTCRVVAFHPEDTAVAAGDDSGRILLWNNFGEQTFYEDSKSHVVKEPLSKRLPLSAGLRREDDAASCTTYHWHSNAVKSLLFSSDGTYLFSGGMEAVLVFWQLQTGKQQFLPRLGGHISFIAATTDPSVFSISCTDNGIKFVNIGSMSVEKNIQGIKPQVALPDFLKKYNIFKACIEPQEGNLVVSTDSLSLQFFDVICNRHLFEVQIVPRTYIGGVDRKSRDWTGSSTFITHVAFSADGSIMATVDFRLSEENIGGGSCLKFWNREHKKQELTLNTVIDEPHSAEISALVYHPARHMAVSCSPAGNFKVWVLSEMWEKQPKYAQSWRCRSVGSYRQKKMLAAAFSPDGSILAVSAEELVTLWNPISNGLLRVLVGSPLSKDFSFLGFVHNSKRLVACSSGGKPQLIVWDLPTLSVWWSCYLKVDALAVDPRTSHFGVIVASSLITKFSMGNAANSNVVCLFNVDDPVPLATWQIQEGLGGELSFIQSDIGLTSEMKSGDDQKPSSMVVLTTSREFVMLNSSRQEDEMVTLPTLESPVEKCELLIKCRSFLVNCGYLLGLAFVLYQSIINSIVFFSPLVVMPGAAPSAFVAMYGKNVTQNRKQSTGVVGIRAQKPWGDLFSAPSHLLPPLSRVSYVFVESLLEKQVVSL